MDALKPKEPEQSGTEPFFIKPTSIVSCLMDKCPKMRGEKNCVEKKLRDVNKSLLDISGDTVHMINNAAKYLLKPFEKETPKIFKPSSSEKTPKNSKSSSFESDGASKNLVESVGNDIYYKKKSR